MKVFVWERIKNATPDSHAYHTEGGVVVFAETEARAREIALLQDCRILDDEAPDEVRTTPEGGEAVYVMPDAGCC